MRPGSEGIREVTEVPLPRVPLFSVFVPHSPITSTTTTVALALSLSPTLADHVRDRDRRSTPWCKYSTVREDTGHL